MRLSTPLLLSIFFALVFILSFYDLFHILDHVRSAEFGKEPTLITFVGFNFLPKVIFYLVKFSALMGTFYGSMLLFIQGNRSDSNSPRRILRVLVSVEFIMLSLICYKVIYFGLLNGNFTLEEYQNFHPFTLHDPEKSGFLNRLTAHFGPFDFLYILLLTLKISAIFEIQFSKSIALVVVSYILPLILWIRFLHFIGL